MYNIDDIVGYHCPRWNELPDIELYMDQVLVFIEKNTAVFAESGNCKSLTKTMINNYVKQNKIKPPVKKRYNKTHLAYFMVVSILKRFMNLSELSDGIITVRRKYTPERAYNLFCDGFEASLKGVFLGKDMSAKEKPADEIALVNTVTAAYANMLYARYLIYINSQK
ncbi:MAG: DUF1836 domain-containing protein [Eubacteriales bacterium]|jgi:hypothetical protein|nr:DUF1836 domain-containing protein [Eubacteriales bacterium]